MFSDITGAYPPGPVSGNPLIPGKSQRGLLIIERRFLGVGIQDLEPVFPDLVQLDPDVDLRPGVGFEVCVGETSEDGEFDLEYFGPTDFVSATF